VFSDLEQTLGHWLVGPLTGKLVLVLAGITLIILVTRLLRSAAARYMCDNIARYKVRKVVTFFGYLATLIFIALVFSDKLGGFTVAFGVAGAGVAFGLQEVIASVAGWMAVSFGGFYKSATAWSLAASRAM
jgi:small-conductance mechanosensitive channel